MAPRNASMSRRESSPPMMASRTRCRKRAPHCAPKPAPPGASGFGDPFVVLHVLGYRDLPRLPAAHLIVHPLQQAPAVGNIGTRIVVAAPDIADPADSVEPQTVAIALLEPAQDIVAQELAHFAAAVIGPRAPWRSRAPVIVEVDASEPVLIPAVELPQIEIVGTKMVVNHVEDY